MRIYARSRSRKKMIVANDDNNNDDDDDNENSITSNKKKNKDVVMEATSTSNTSRNFYRNRTPSSLSTLPTAAVAGTSQPSGIKKVLCSVAFLLVLLSALMKQQQHVQENYLLLQDPTTKINTKNTPSENRDLVTDNELKLKLKLASTTRTTVSGKEDEKEERLSIKSPKSNNNNNNNNNSITSQNTTTTTTTIAYAISLIKCGDGKQNDGRGLTEAALVLRHSIHHISSRNVQSGSRYDYHLYALVHRQAAPCAQPLQVAGFDVHIVDPPVTTQEIPNGYLKRTIHKEVCCGADEFIKLHAFGLPHPITVHVDIDFIFLKPLDDLLDAILYDASTPQGHAARQSIQSKVESQFNPHVISYNQHNLLDNPQSIDAFIVRDWFSTFPGRPSPYQAGFIVARHNPSLIQLAVDIVKTGNYTEGFARNNGWGGLGYGGFIGARAMQGLLAYMYDIVRPGTHLELDSCLYNHIGTHLVGKGGKCKTGRDDLPCPDCRTTPLNQIYSIHYTACRKPWNCVSEAVPGGRTQGASYGNAIDTTVANVEHCLLASQIWHQHRADLERRILKQVTQSTSSLLSPSSSFELSESGEYQRDYFLGHCLAEKKYLGMQLLNNTNIYEEVYRSEYSEDPLFYMPK